MDSKQIHNRQEAANFIKMMRMSRKITQDDAAEALDVSTHTIQNWESCFRFRYPENLHALLELYGADDETTHHLDHFLLYETR